MAGHNFHVPVGILYVAGVIAVNQLIRLKGEHVGQAGLHQVDRACAHGEIFYQQHSPFALLLGKPEEKIASVEQEFGSRNLLARLRRSRELLLHRPPARPSGKLWRTLSS